MAGKQSGAMDKAQKEFERATTKPSARQLATKHGLNESTVHRAAWFIPIKERKNG